MQQSLVSVRSESVLSYLVRSVLAPWIGQAMLMAVRNITCMAL